MIAALTTSQISTGFTTVQVALLTTTELAALTTSQVSLGLTTNQLAALTSSQIVGLSNAMLTALTTSQIATGLSTAQVAVLTSSELAALTTSQISLGLTTTQVASLTSDQLATLNTRTIAALSTAQIASLTTNQVSTLSTTTVSRLTTAQLSTGFSTVQVMALTTVELAALTTAQVAGGLTTVQLNSLTTTQVAGLTTRALNAFTTTQMSQGLTTTQIGALTTFQIASLSTSEVKALTSSQLGALSVAQFQNLNLASPIVLDLDGNGVKTLGIEAGVQFDVFGSGNKVNTGWVAATDGLLALDRNNDGVINDGGELFGTATKLADGSNAANGYAALATLDTNGDGSITSADAGFDKLRVWVDANSDGVSQSSELKSLAQLNVASIGLDAAKTTVKDNGNWLGMAGSYTSNDGSVNATADVWFLADKNQGAADLKGSVGSLVNAMASFSAVQAAPAAATGSLDDKKDVAKAFAGVGQLVDVLRRYDANGNTLASSNHAAPDSDTLKLKSVQHTSSGFLAVPVK